MKKLKTLLLVMLTFVIGVFCLAACGDDAKATGTYKFVSQSYTDSEGTQELKVGENGLTEDYIVVEIKKDGTFVQKITSGGETEEMTGTWTQDGKTVTFTYDANDTQTGTLDGDTLTFTDAEGEYSSTIVLKK